MKIYTSNFFKYQGDNMVQISNSYPKCVHPIRAIPELYPEWKNVAAWNAVKDFRVDDVERMSVWYDFETAYISKLDNMGVDKVMSLLQEGDVLCCWCSGNCHRHILADWLTAHGQDVREV